MDSLSILRLYSNVLHEDINRYQVSSNDIRSGIQNMKDVYLPQPESLKSNIVNVANYNDIAHRIAYLHKYATLHTDMVKTMMQRIISENETLFYDVVFGPKQFNICSLGGGPGSDVIGVLVALLHFFNNFKSSVTIVDCMRNWEQTFAQVLLELAYGQYGPLISNHVTNNLSWQYIDCDLLKNMTNPVNKAIGSATLVTMVKFVSAAACIDTESMLSKIFRCMKPGALILFIDNAAGGFHQLLTKAARESKFISVFGPLRHENFSKPELEIKRFGYISCHSTTVTVHLLQKPLQRENRNRPKKSPNRQNPTVIQNTDTRSVLNENDKIINFYSDYDEYFPAIIPKPVPKVNINESNISIPARQKLNNVSPKRSSPIKNLSASVNVGKQYAYSNIPSLSPSSSVPSNTSIVTSPPKSSTYITHSNSYVPAAAQKSQQSYVSPVGFAQNSRHTSIVASPPKSSTSIKHSNSYVSSTARKSRQSYVPPVGFAQNTNAAAGNVRHSSVPNDYVEDSNDTCCACCVIS